MTSTRRIRRIKTPTDGDEAPPTTSVLSWTTFWQLIVIVIVIDQLILQTKTLQSNVIRKEIDFSAGTTAASLQQQQQQHAASAFRNDNSLCRRLSEASSPSSSSSSQTANSSSTVAPLSSSQFWTTWVDQELFQKASTYPAETWKSPNSTDFRNEIHNLLLDLPPYLLRRGLLNRPPKKDVDKIWKKLDDQQKARERGEATDPIRVLIMGGSVTEGGGCFQSDTIKGRSCNWSVRLEYFVNTLLGYEAIRVFNIANGGTNTAQGIALLKYSMIPDEVVKHAPDIIVNAYGMNDSHLGSKPPTEVERISEVMQNSLNRLNWFVQVVNDAYPCPATRPVVLYLDDYFGGHGDGSMVGDATYRMTLTEFAVWKNLGVVSSARVKAPLIYPNPKMEKSVSPEWRMSQKLNERGEREMKPDVHFNYLGHQTVVWVWMYYFLEVAIGYCEEHDVRLDYTRKDENLGAKRSSSWTEEAKNVIDNEAAAPGYHLGTYIHNLGKEFKETFEKEEKNAQESCSESGPSGSACTMAWIAGPEGRTSNKATLSQYLRPYLKDNNGWNYAADLSHGWSRKLGFVATKAKSTFRISLPRVEQPIKYVTMQYLKSYGEQWEGSELLLTLQSRPAESSTDENAWTSVANMTLVGVHNSATSISYTDVMVVDPPPAIGSDVRLNAELVGGTNFKFTGMMFCSR